jgi:YggT family protein
MDFIISAINITANIFIAMIFVRVILSWFVKDASHPLVRFTTEATEPLLGPIRRALPRTGMLDLSPLLALLLIDLIRGLLNNML